MKKIFLLLTVFAMVFTSCDPLEDINAEIDAQESAIVGDATYILTSDDYDALELSFGSFSSVDDAKAKLPAFLTEKYPVWGKSSSVNVGYQLYIGNAEGVSDYSRSDAYQFTNGDYATTGSDAFGFYPDVDPLEKIPSILDTQIASPTEGQIVLAKYKQYTETPVVGLADIVKYNFAGSMEGWTITDVVGALGWTSESGYVQGNGFSGGQQANEDWLISPEIDLSTSSNLKFQITHELDYAGDKTLLKILVSTDYTNDITTANWTEITLGTPVSGSMAASEDYDFSAYDGEKINIALKYESTDSDAGRWRVESLAIKTLGATGETASKGTHFKYSGSAWEAVDDVYYLSSADFDSMGEASGQPGRYNNFGSSIPPNDYLPKFLGLKYPYAQEATELFVIYDYFSSSSGAQVRGNLFTFTGGVWVAYESTISTTLQFGHDGTSWLPDNTIKYTLTRGANSDYDWIASQLTTDEYSGLIGNLSNYDDFDYNWTDAQITYSLVLFLDYLDPTAAEGQKYTLTYVVYDNGEGDYTKNFIKTNGEWVINN